MLPAYDAETREQPGPFSCATRRTVGSVPAGRAVTRCSTASVLAWLCTPGT